MKSIEEIKAEIIVKIFQDGLTGFYIGKLPKNDELRSLLCQFDPKYIYCYAYWVDKCPHDETRRACLKDPWFSYCYAVDIDKCAREDTREAAYKDPEYKEAYIRAFGE